MAIKRGARVRIIRGDFAGNLGTLGTVPHRARNICVYLDGVEGDAGIQYIDKFDFVEIGSVADQYDTLEAIVAKLTKPRIGIIEVWNGDFDCALCKGSTGDSAEVREHRVVVDGVPHLRDCPIVLAHQWAVTTQKTWD